MASPCLQHNRNERISEFCLRACADQEEVTPRVLTEHRGGRGPDLGAERAAAEAVHAGGGGRPRGHAAYVVDAGDDQPVRVALCAARHGTERRLALRVAREGEGVRPVVDWREERAPRQRGVHAPSYRVACKNVFLLLVSVHCVYWIPQKFLSIRTQIE